MQASASCPLCKIKYDDGVHYPRKAPCSHSFCLSCTDKFLQKKKPSKCKICKQELPLLRLSRYPKNPDLVPDEDEIVANRRSKKNNKPKSKTPIRPSKKSEANSRTPKATKGRAKDDSKSRSRSVKRVTSTAKEDKKSAIKKVQQPEFLLFDVYNGDDGSLISTICLKPMDTGRTLFENCKKICQKTISGPANLKIEFCHIDIELSDLEATLISLGLSTKKKTPIVVSWVATSRDLAPLKTYSTNSQLDRDELMRQFQEYMAYLQRGQRSYSNYPREEIDEKESSNSKNIRIVIWKKAGEKICELDMNKYDSIYTIKQEIEKKTGNQPRNQQLFFENQELNNVERTLKGLGMEAGDHKNMLCVNKSWYESKKRSGEWKYAGSSSQSNMLALRY